MLLKHLGICLCGLSLFGASAFGAVTTKNSGKSASNGATSAAGKILAGPVSSIDIGKKEIVVDRNGKHYPVIIDASTNIVSANSPITLETIKPGDHVSVEYVRSSDGRRTALTIDSKSTVARASHKASAAKPALQKKAVAAKVEVKAEPKKEAAAAPKAEVKAEAKKDSVSAAKPEAKVEPKKDPAAAQPAKASN